jgi:cysteine desulfurase / selenocysteine lyase
LDAAAKEVIMSYATIIDLPRVRADTPGIANRIHLNNAGAALMPKPVIAAMKEYIDLEAAIGGYEAEAQEIERLDGVYDSVARLIGAERDEIALTENATVAWDMAFYALRFRPGDRILTAQAEYAANYIAYLQVAKRTGAVIDIIPSDETGALDPYALENMIDERVKLISITWIPTNGGLVNPAEDVGRIAKRHDIMYLLDACQALGQMPVDVKQLNCDILSATGRKFLRGPRGTGFLYVRRSRLAGLEPPMIDLFAATWAGPEAYILRNDTRRFETWENNYALRLGLGVAIEYARSIGLDAIQRRCIGLADRLRNLLLEIPGAAIHDLGVRPSAIVSLTVEGAGSDALETHLREKRINTGVSTPSSTPMDAAARRLPAVLRLSPHYYNSEDEMVRTAEAIRRFVRSS